MKLYIIFNYLISNIILFTIYFDRLQITKLQGDVDEMVNQLNNMQEEKENLLTQIEDIPIALANWKEQERKLQLDLEEARSSSIQGVQSLREELRSIL